MAPLMMRVRMRGASQAGAASRFAQVRLMPDIHAVARTPWELSTEEAAAMAVMAARTPTLPERGASLSNSVRTCWRRDYLVQSRIVSGKPLTQDAHERERRFRSLAQDCFERGLMDLEHPDIGLCP